MTNNILKFYQDLLNVVGLSLNDNNEVVLLGSRGNQIPITVDGKPLALPTKENIKTAIAEENGELVLTKLLFNPLEESAIRGDNKSFLKLVELIERKVNHAFAAVGETIFSALAKGIEINDPDLLKFIKILSEYKAPNVKKVVDDNTVGHWVELFRAVKNLETNELFIHLYIKKGGKIKGVRYNRTATVIFPIYEKLRELKKDEPLHGVKLRKKDVFVYEKYHEFTFNTDSDTLLKGISFGSKNNVSPGMHVLIQAYEFIKEAINSVIDSLIAEDIDVEDMEELRLPDMPMTPDDFDTFINEVKMELKEIPTESDLLLTARAVGVDRFANEIEKDTTPSRGVNPERPTQRQQEEDTDALKALLARGGYASGFSNPPAGGSYPSQPAGPDPLTAFTNPHAVRTQTPPPPPPACGGYDRGYQPPAYGYPQPGYQQPTPYDTYMRGY